jgi:hypothetical protein
MDPQKHCSLINGTPVLSQQVLIINNCNCVFGIGSFARSSIQTATFESFGLALSNAKNAAI